MKKRYLLSGVFTSLLALGALTGCGNGKGEAADYTIKVWCASNVVDLTKQQAQEWAAEAHPDLKIAFDVQAQGEGDAAANMILDVQAGADVYCFAQDQLARLKSAGALQTITDPEDKAAIIAANDEISISASMVGDELVAYPITSDNGFFAYYDKSVLSADDMKNQTTMIAKVKEAGKKIYFDGGNAWYNAGYFFAFGCESTWTTNELGLFTDYVDTYNSKGGVKALKALYELVSEESVYVAGHDASEAFSSGAAVCFSGTWDYAVAEQLLGDNLGACEMPSVTVDGETQHLGSFIGCKLIGVKPQTDADKLALSQQLAQYLSGEKAQSERFSELAWGPCNKVAQAKPEVLANAGLQAIQDQMSYAKVQGQYPGDWWTSAGKLGGTDLQSSDGSDTALKNLLKTYEATVDSYING